MTVSVIPSHRPAHLVFWSDLAGPLFGVARPNSVDWMGEAACVAAGDDPEPFFPSRGQSNALRVAQARCAGCPVRSECLVYGLGERQGVWGGTSDRERRRIRASLRRRAERWGVTLHPFAE